MNQGPADLQSAALTTELCTHLTFSPPASFYNLYEFRISILRLWHALVETFGACKHSKRRIVSTYRACLRTKHNNRSANPWYLFRILPTQSIQALKDMREIQSSQHMHHFGRRRLQAGGSETNHANEFAVSQARLSPRCDGDFSTLLMLTPRSFHPQQFLFEASLRRNTLKERCLIRISCSLEARGNVPANSISRQMQRK